MTPGSQTEGLQIDQDMDAQRRQWKVERIGWILMLLVAAAALAGLLGPGPLSSQKAGEEGGELWVEYERFARYQSPQELAIHVGPGASRDGTVRLELDREFIEHIEIARVEPEPAAVASDAERFVFTFRAPQPGAATLIFFRFEPRKFGPMPIGLSVEGGPALRLRQLYYP